MSATIDHTLDVAARQIVDACLDYTAHRLRQIGYVCEAPDCTCVLVPDAHYIDPDTKQHYCTQACSGNRKETAS